MTKTPDEIKKGLECCCDLMGVMCPYCPYAEDGDASETCKEEMADDALALIRHKEKENAEQAETIERLNTGVHELIIKIQQLEAERDALYGEVRRCFYCIYVEGVLGECDQCCESCEADCPCKECDHYNKFEWRGVQKEE